MPGARWQKRWPRSTSPGIGPTSLRCTIGHAAESNCPPILSSAVASGPRLPTSAASMVRALPDPESWVAQRISPLATPSYTSRWSVKSQPWLSHHVIYGTVVVPGATYAAMALAAVGTPAQVRDVFFYEPIILPEKTSREVQLTLHPVEDGGGWTFQVHSRPYGERDAEWSLNADGRIVAGVDDEPAPEPAESIDAACERLSRTRPQQLFDTFADMELTWGPTWSTSLKSLWAGDGEAVGDIAIGEELAEQLGSEPIHPVLLDLCTGVAFPAFPAVLAAAERRGSGDLFLPLRYGRVVLRERMPRRFYCRARWQTGGSDSETQVFDLDFVDRDGRQLGGIRDFTVKRAPREALLRGLGGDATRNLYTLDWQEVRHRRRRTNAAKTATAPG